MKKIALLSIALCLVCSCAQVYPFVDARREAGQVKTVGSSTKDNPVICYGFFGTEEERFALAQAECEKTGRIAVFKEKKIFDCKLLVPSKDIFECKMPTEAESKHE